MRKGLPPLLLALLAAGCRGTAPVYYGESSLGFSAVLIRARAILPTGEVKNTEMALNFESPAESYRLAFDGERTAILRLEPGTYRLHPTRNILGLVQSTLKVRIGRRSYRVPFPREILRMSPVTVKPARVVPLGVLEARLIPAEKGRRAQILLRLDTDAVTRRQMVEEVIENMLNPKVPLPLRESSVSWTRSLESALAQVQQEAESRPSYKPSTP